MAKTHALDWKLDKGPGWITRCGVFVDANERLSDDPTCPRCRCWLGLCDCTETHLDHATRSLFNDGADRA